MELQTSRLIIKPCTKELLENYNCNFEEMGPHITSYLKELEEDPSLYGFGVWLVIQKETNEIIGDIGFKGKPDSNNTVEIGYGIKLSAQNNGYATEAVCEIIKWAFSTNKVTKVKAECLIDNYASIRVLQKLNMKRYKIEDNMIYWELIK